MAITKETIGVQCGTCEYKVEVPINGDTIQSVLPNVSPGDRELFISGICGNCFDKLFE